jgi:phosphate transport system permease protein
VIPTQAMPAEPAKINGVERDFPAAEQPRKLRARTVDDRASWIGSRLGSAALAWLITEQLVPVHGYFGFVVCWYLCFFALYTGVSSIGNPRTVVIDRLMASIVSGGAALVATAIVTAIVFVYWRGFPALPHLNFYGSDMSGVEENAVLSQGGVLHAVAGSLIEITIAVLVTLPLGVGTAVFMTEIGGKFARVVRTVVEAMTALPSVVAGLFIYSVLIVTAHFPRTGFAASMAMSVMMLPIIARAADVVLRVVPGGLREAGLALGSTQWRTLWHVVLPTARPGLATALILGVARGIGETSPVLLTSGASTYMNLDPFHNAMNSLPLYIYFAVRSGVPKYIVRGYGAAAVLLAIVLCLFVAARRLARQKGGRS